MVWPFSSSSNKSGEKQKLNIIGENSLHFSNVVPLSNFSFAPDHVVDNDNPADAPEEPSKKWDYLKTAGTALLFGGIAFAVANNYECNLDAIVNAGYPYLIGMWGGLGGFLGNLFLTFDTIMDLLQTEGSKLVDGFLSGSPLNKLAAVATALSAIGAALSVFASTYIGMSDSETFWDKLGNWLKFEWLKPAAQVGMSTANFFLVIPQHIISLLRTLIESLRNSDHNALLRSLIHLSSDMATESGSDACDYISKLKNSAEELRNNSQEGDLFFSQFIEKIEELKKLPQETEQDRAHFCKEFNAYLTKISIEEQVAVIALILENKNFITEGGLSYGTYILTSLLCAAVASVTVSPALFGIGKTIYQAVWDISLLAGIAEDVADLLSDAVAGVWSVISDPAKWGLYVMSTKTVFQVRFRELLNSFKWFVSGIDAGKIQAYVLFSLVLSSAVALSGACYSNMAKEAAEFFGAESAPIFVYVCALLGAGLVNWNSAVNFLMKLIPKFYPKDHVRGYNDLAAFLKKFANDAKTTFPTTADGQAYAEGLQNLFDAMPHPNDANDGQDYIPFLTRLFGAPASFFSTNPNSEQSQDRKREKADALNRIFKNAGEKARERTKQAQYINIGSINDAEESESRPSKAPSAAKNQSGFFWRAASNIGSSVSSAASYLCCSMGNNG